MEENSVSYEEVIAVMQARFPKELEICVLTVQNQKLAQSKAEESGEEDPDIRVA